MIQKRILMTEEGSSPGGGAAPPASAEPQAQAEPPITMAALKELLGTLKAEIVSDAKNGVNADLRRAGVFKKAAEHEPAATTQQPPPTGSAPASSGLSAADVEAMLDRERVITARKYEYGLSDAQVRRMKSALTGVTGDLVSSEADAFLNDLGIAKATPITATQQAAAPVVPTGAAQPPISDKGSPAPGGVLDWEREYAENPIGMSSAARQRMDAKYGADKARRMRVEAAQRQAETIKVTKPQG
jgi:hypothetical protein